MCARRRRLGRLLLALASTVVCLTPIGWGTAPAFAQDLESLLVEFSTGRPTAAADLVGLGQPIIPKLLDYAVGKRDTAIAEMAIEALSLFPDADFSFVIPLLESPSTEAYAIKCVRLLERRAAAIEPAAITRLQSGLARDPRALTFAIGKIGIESVYRLHLALGAGFDDRVRRALLQSRDARSIQVLMDGLEGRGALPQAWAREAFDIMTQHRLASIANGRFAKEDDDTGDTREGDSREDDDPELVAAHRKLREVASQVPRRAFERGPMPPPFFRQRREPRPLDLEDALYADAAARTQLLGCVKRADCAYRASSTLMLGLADKSEVTPVLQSLLADEQQAIRWNAACTLANNYGSRDTPGLGPVLRELLTSGPLTCRRIVTAAFRWTDSSPQELETALRDADKTTRWNAALAFRKAPPPAALPVLLEMLGEPDSYVPDEALATFGAAALPAIKAALESKDAKIQRNGLEVLGKLEPSPERQQLLPSVIALLKDPDAGARAAACLATMTGGEASKAVVDALLPLLRDTDYSRRTAAIDTLVQIGRADPRVVPSLVTLAASGEEAADYTATKLSEITPITDDTLAGISAALDADDLNERWVESIHTLLTQYWVRRCLEQPAFESSHEFRLLSAHKPEVAIAAVLARLDRTPTDANAIRLAAALVNGESRYSDERKEIEAVVFEHVKAHAEAGSGEGVGPATLHLLLGAHPLRGMDFAYCDARMADAKEELEGLNDLLKPGTALRKIAEQSLAHADVQTRTAAAVLLRTVGTADPRLRLIFREALADADPWTRRFAAVQVILRDRVDARALDILIRADAQDDYDCALHVAKRLPPQRQQLLAAGLAPLLADQDDLVRLQTALALLSLNPRSQDAIRALRSFAESADETRVETAVKALFAAGASGEESIELALHKLIGGSGADNEEARKILEAIGEPAYPRLLSVARTGEETLARAAAATIGEAFGVKALPRLDAMLAGNDPALQLVALRALTAMGPSALPLRARVMAFRSAKEQTHADSAAWALFKMAPEDVSQYPHACRALNNTPDFSFGDRTSPRYEFEKAVVKGGAPAANAITSAIGTLLTSDAALSCLTESWGWSVDEAETNAFERLLAAPSLSPVSKRLMLLQAKGHIDCRNYVRTILPRLFSDPSAEIRLAAISVAPESLSCIPDGQRTAMRALMSTDPSIDVRSALVLSMKARPLAEQGDPEERVTPTAFRRRRNEPQEATQNDRLDNEALMALLIGDGDARIRQLAASALQKGRVEASAAVIPLLGVIASDAQNGVKLQALDSLYTFVPFSDQGILDRLLPALQDDRNTVLKEAVARFVGEARIPLSESSRAAVIGMVADPAQSAAIRRSLACALAADPAGTADLVRLAANEQTDPLLRLLAIEALGHSTDTASVPALAALLSSPDAAVRLQTLRSLAHQGSRASSAVGLLMPALRSGGAEERLLAVQALGQIGPASFAAVDAIVSADADTDTDMTAAIVQTLGRIGTLAAASRDYLVRRLSHANVYIRRDAAFALREMTPVGGDAVPALIKALDDEDLEVAQNAAGALGAYGVRAADALLALEAHGDRDGMDEFVACAIGRITSDNQPGQWEAMQFRSSIARLDKWPPPRPSDFRPLETKYFSGAVTLRDVYQRLSKALLAQQYSVTVMQAPNGFALAARLERFDPVSGRSLSEPERWREQPSFRWNDSSSWQRALFGQDIDSRVFLFIVTDQEVGAQLHDRLSRQSLVQWVSSRGVMLPGSVTGSFDGKQCLALVYHFVGRERTFDLTSQTLSLETHLKQAGILDKLEAYVVH